MDLRKLTKENATRLNPKPSRGQMALIAVKKGRTIRLNGSGGFIIVDHKEEDNGENNGK